MSPKALGRPRSERAKQAILSSALSLLEDGGVAKVTIEAVALRAKVGKPTIYRYWSNAQELAMAAVIAEPETKTKEPKDLGPLQALRKQVASVIKRFSSPSGRQTAILMASADSDSELSKAFRNQVILKSREQGRVLLEQAIAEKVIDDQRPIECLLDMIYGPIFYRLLTGHAKLHGAFADEIIDSLFPNAKMLRKRRGRS